MEKRETATTEPSIDQVGIVVRDLYSVVSSLEELLGIRNVRIMEWPIEGVDPEATYHGEPGNYHLLLGFVKVGKTQIELIQPLEGQNIYSDFLEEHGPGLHHFRLTVADFEDRIAALEAQGIENIASGTGVHVGSKWAYFDTRAPFQGVIVELRKHLDDLGGEGKWINS